MTTATAAIQAADDASPDTNEQLEAHWSVIVQAEVNWASPPNASIWIGLARPHSDLNRPLTTRPDASARPEIRNSAFRASRQPVHQPRIATTTSPSSISPITQVEDLRSAFRSGSVVATKPSAGS